MRHRPASPAGLVLGSFVRLTPDGPLHRVVWRGRQPMPHTSDWPGEVAVYRLDDGHWDCYYEPQLLPASPWHS